MVIKAYCVNHVVHQFINFGPLEPRLATIFHDFGITSYNNKSVKYVHYFNLYNQINQNFEIPMF